MEVSYTLKWEDYRPELEGLGWGPAARHKKGASLGDQRKGDSLVSQKSGTLGPGLQGRLFLGTRMPAFAGEYHPLDVSTCPHR